MAEALQVEDRLYGSFEVSSPLLIDLINCPPVQRLKRVNQFGIPDDYYHYKNFSRFEHSLGVMYLLKQLGASEEKQAAGLLHDVSHRAFSHTFDWVVTDRTRGEVSEDEQDKLHSDFILNSVIPAILQRYGYDPSRVVDYHNFGLLEQDIPDLCADRVDYCLREIPERGRVILPGLVVGDGQIVCVDEKNAAMMGRLFLDRQVTHWGEEQAIRRYYYFSQALKIALEAGELSFDDFLQDDKYVFAKVEKSTDPRVKTLLEMVKDPQVPQLAEKVVRVHKKFRHVDPLFKTSLGLMRLSAVDHEFAYLLVSARIQNSQGVLVVSS